MSKDIKINKVSENVFSQASKVTDTDRGLSATFTLEIDFSGATHDQLCAWAFSNRKIAHAPSLRKLSNEELKALNGSKLRVTVEEIATGKKGVVSMDARASQVAANIDQLSDESLKKIAEALKAKGVI